MQRRNSGQSGSPSSHGRSWAGWRHPPDWLGLDAPSGSYKGSSREDFITSAYYAYSTELVIRAGRTLGEDVSAYEALYARIVAAFRNAYPEYLTQTECVLAAHFRLAEDPQKAADLLARKVREAGVQLQTGFLGTPYILHVLSDYGYADLAWALLLRREYPSWLYPITKGATTIWEHWDGIMPDGGFWSRDMNSFNHYAYGSVMDWVYGVAAGIQVCEDAPGYARIRIAPHPTETLDWLEASIRTRHGLVSVRWTKTEDGCALRYHHAGRNGAGAGRPHADPSAGPAGAPGRLLIIHITHAPGTHPARIFMPRRVSGHLAKPGASQYNQQETHRRSRIPWLRFHVRMRNSGNTR